jgi:hypothetical protein
MVEETILDGDPMQLVHGDGSIMAQDGAIFLGGYGGNTNVTFSIPYL